MLFHAAIDIEGPRDAVVPLQGLSVSPARSALGLGNAEVRLKKSGAELTTGPTIGSDEAYKLDDASFTRQI